jgi:glycosyltransferase involved in cell wall biosynthesis
VESSMTIEQPLLTIGIPTWNRSKELEGCIEIIASQIVALEEPIDILISDNGSNDGTEDVVARMRAKYSFIGCTRSAVNVGADMNFLETFRKATGEYVWLFSDDDFLADGALARVVEIIRGFRPCHISTNYSWCDNERRPVAQFSEAKFMVDKDIPNADINTVFARRVQLLGFMGCSIYRRDLLDVPQYEAIKDKVKHWIQVYATAHVISDRKDAYLSSFYAVAYRRGNARDVSTVYVKSMPDAFDFIFTTFGVKEDVRARVYESIRSHFLPLKTFIRNTALGVEISRHLVLPGYFKLIPKVPYGVVLFALRTKRLLTGKGFTLPEGVAKSTQAD